MSVYYTPGDLRALLKAKAQRIVIDAVDGDAVQLLLAAESVLAIAQDLCFPVEFRPGK